MSVAKIAHGNFNSEIQKKKKRTENIVFNLDFVYDLITGIESIQINTISTVFCGDSI